MRRLPGSTALSVFCATLAISATSCGLRTTLDTEPGAPSQAGAGTSGKLDGGLPGGAVSPDAATTTNPFGTADASPGTVIPPVPDAAPPTVPMADAAFVTAADTRPATVRPDASLQGPETGLVIPPAGRDAGVGRSDLGVANRDAGVPIPPPSRDAGFMPPRFGTDGGLTFPSPDLGTGGPRVRDGGFAFPGLGIDGGFTPPFAMDGGFPFGVRDSGRRLDTGRSRAATPQP